MDVKLLFKPDCNKGRHRSTPRLINPIGGIQVSRKLLMKFSRLWWFSACLGSLQTQGHKDVPTLQGKLFAFSYAPTFYGPIKDPRLTVSVSTFLEGTVATRIQCKRYCGKNTTDGTVLNKYLVNFGSMKNYEIPNSRDKGTSLFRPFNQSVYTVSSVKPVVVLLIEMIVYTSKDCAFVYPYVAAATEYITIVLNGSETYLQIVTFASKTNIKIKAVDQYDVIDRYSSFTGYKPLKQDNCERRKGGCHNQSYPISEWPSVTSVKYITFNKILTYSLESFQALSLSRFLPLRCCDFSGYEITSDKPVSVKVGAAIHFQNTFEFLQGKKHLGRNFIIPRNRLLEVKANMKVLTAVDLSSISIEISVKNLVQQLILLKTGDWFSRLTDGTEDIAIKATKAILVGIITHKDTRPSKCFMIILPKELWSDTYIWTDLSITHFYKSTYFVTILTQDSHKDGIVLDDQKLISFTNINLFLFTDKKWASYTQTTNKGTHLAYRQNNREPFLIKLYTNSTLFASCTIPGITFRALNSKCFPTKTVPGDDVDNDCDGRFDEELEDAKDNDSDNKIDEDLKARPRINGKWSSWTSNSACLVNCGETEGFTYNQIRHCDNPKPENDGLPCEGESTRLQKSSCTKELILCPDQCEPFTYGYNCTKKCDKCELPCDAETGICKKCKPGLTPPFCNKTCSVKNCNTCSWSGTCMKCDRGFFNPPICEPCLDGKFGENCIEDCSTANCSACHGHTGECFKCKHGLQPPLCIDKCKNNNCYVCTKADFCISCKPGYINPPICSPCPNDTYGESCKYNCSENCLNCDNANGTCYECEKNFELPNCDECSRGFYNTPFCAPCPDGFFGDKCSEICLPSPGCARCHGDTGECFACDLNFMSPNCTDTIATNNTHGFLSKSIVAGVASLVLSSVGVSLLTVANLQGKIPIYYMAEAECGET